MTESAERAALSSRKRQSAREAQTATCRRAATAAQGNRARFRSRSNVVAAADVGRHLARPGDRRAAGTREHAIPVADGQPDRQPRRSKTGLGATASARADSPIRGWPRPRRRRHSGPRRLRRRLRRRSAPRPLRPRGGDRPASLRRNRPHRRGRSGRAREAAPSGPPLRLLRRHRSGPGDGPSASPGDRVGPAAARRVGTIDLHGTVARTQLQPRHHLLSWLFHD